MLSTIRVPAPLPVSMLDGGVPSVLANGNLLLVPRTVLLCGLSTLLYTFYKFFLYRFVKHSSLEKWSSAKPSSNTLISDAAHLNAQNSEPRIATSSDVVVVGGGIHSLIYAIQTRLRSQSLLGADPTAHVPSITVLERLTSPGYKIGESTLTTFGVWLKSIGISSSVLWRLFGPKDGLAFYYLPSDGSMEGVTSFCANGPRGDFVATLQIERKISELMLTLFAQRLGVSVMHGIDVDVAATHTNTVPADKLNSNNNSSNKVAVPPNGTGKVKLKSGAEIQTKLLIDATGRFRRFASKEAPSKRFEGFNTDAFWAYFEMDGDESDLPFLHYESCHTNHICFAEGWAWIIRLPTWEGSPIPNLVAMVNHLLDLNAANTPSDDYPSSHELAERFGCKYRWVTSIGYALRDDVSYPSPSKLHSYGTCEAERKFNWITAKYPQMESFMKRHRLVQDLYGDGTTWFIRKKLTYGTPIVAGVSQRAEGGEGMSWAAIGDATGFTNPLYSPGINCNMATSVMMAESTVDLLSTQDSHKKREILQKYNDFCVGRTTNLHRMNKFNYVLMQSPRTGPLGPLWQYLFGTGNPEWRRLKEFSSIDRVAELVTGWEWGAQRQGYIDFADRAISLLSRQLSKGSPDDATVEEVVKLSEVMIATVVEQGEYQNRWAGLLRWYDDKLRFDENKVARDRLAIRCEACGNWRILTGESRKCCICGARCEEFEIQRYN